MIEWLDAGWWPWLCLAPLTWVVVRRLRRSRRDALRLALGPRAEALTDSVDDGRRLRAEVIAIVALLTVSVALMRPAWGEPEAIGVPRGADIVVCLDVSRSMLARDSVPDRLTAAKQAIDDLAGLVRNGRLGLVTFAGEARLRIPLTRDLAAFRPLAALAGPASVRTAGTDIGAALETASRALEPDAKHATVVLLTDGEDHGGSGLAAAERLATTGVVIHTIGFGSELGARIAPSAGGDDVVTHLESSTLRSIAAATGGSWSHADETDRPLVDLFERHIAPRSATDADETVSRPPDRFQWLVLLAVVLWLVHGATGEGRT
ncbi:MAG: VWA domain-containing protein [Planctomycetes bacterium]|nr:VWA domain-containing protein [Planctomycetota bacterium]